MLSGTHVGSRRSSWLAPVLAHDLQATVAQCTRCNQNKIATAYIIDGIETRTVDDCVLAILRTMVRACSVPSSCIKKSHVPGLDAELHVPRHSLLWQDMVVCVGTLGQRVNVLTICGHVERVARIERERVAAWHESGAPSMLLHIFKILRTRVLCKSR